MVFLYSRKVLFQNTIEWPQNGHAVSLASLTGAEVEEVRRVALSRRVSKSLLLQVNFNLLVTLMCRYKVSCIPLARPVLMCVELCV